MIAKRFERVGALARTSGHVSLAANAQAISEALMEFGASDDINRVFVFISNEAEWRTAERLREGLRTVAGVEASDSSPQKPRFAR
jgi:hypothetical protein